MQIKTTMRYHLTLVRMATIEKSINDDCWGCQENRTLLYFWWEYKLVQTLCRTVWRFLKKQKMELPYVPAIPLLCIYLQKNMVQKDICTTVFTAVLFTIGKTWKQPKCPSTDEWIKKIWYTYTIECYSAIERNPFESALMRWMNLEPITQSEVNQKEKDKYQILTHIYGI